MRRFYTHVLYGTGLAEDPEGQEFASIEDASNSARHAARIIIAKEIEAGRDPIALEFRIQNEAGDRLSTISANATISVVG